jgi:hypothetical protein
MPFKSTREILELIKGGNKPDHCKTVTGIPEFDPEKHSDGCSGGMSAAYARLPQTVRDRFGETLPWSWESARSSRRIKLHADQH